MNNGYVEVNCPAHPKAHSSGFVYAHILAAEQKLNRHLSDIEVVHHLNGIRTDNRPENLIVFKSNSDHSRYHQTNALCEDGDVYVSPTNREPAFCVDCGISIYWEALRCNKCAHIRLRRVARPDKEVLLSQINEYNYCWVGRYYGVSDNAIRKWLKTY